MRDLADRDLEERIQAWSGCPAVCTEFNMEELVFFSFWFCRHSPRPEWAAAGRGMLAHRHKGLMGGGEGRKEGREGERKGGKSLGKLENTLFGIHRDRR